MDLTLLKKKISSYRTPKGRITSLPDELLGEILHAWEAWTGSANGFYMAIGSNHHKMASMMGRAKKLKREGVFDGLKFTELVIEEESEVPSSPCGLITGCNIELIYKDNVIRFGNSDLLIDFLKKAA